MFLVCGSISPLMRFLCNWLPNVLLCCALAVQVLRFLSHTTLLPCLQCWHVQMTWSSLRTPAGHMHVQKLSVRARQVLSSLWADRPCNSAAGRCTEPSQPRVWQALGSPQAKQAAQRVDAQLCYNAAVSKQGVCNQAWLLPLQYMLARQAASVYDVPVCV